MGKIIIAGIVIALLGFFFLGSDEEAAVRKVLTEIEELTEFEQPLTQINTAVRLGQLEKRLTNTIDIRAFSNKNDWQHQITSIDQLKSIAFLGARAARSHAVVLDQMSISVDSDKANANFQVISEGIAERGRFKNILSVRVNLEKSEDGDWLVSSAQGEFVTPDYQ